MFKTPSTRSTGILPVQSREPTRTLPNGPRQDAPPARRMSAAIILAVTAMSLPRLLSAQTAAPAATAETATAATATAETATGPTSQLTPAEGMLAVVEMVEGAVRVRMSAAAEWQPATVGLQLPEGAEIRTGLKGAIRCVIPPDQTFVLDRLTTLTLSQAVRQGSLVKTDLTMKYGRAQYEIERAGLDHDAKITSPGSTLAVRGTIVELEDSPPFRPRAVSYTGKARFTAERKTTPLGSAGGSRAALEAGQQNTAINALEASIIDPQNASSRSPADARLIAQQVSLGGVARFDRESNITVIRGGSGPLRSEADVISSLPGVLVFVARWTGNADLNLELSVSRGDPATTVLTTGEFKFSEFIYPGFGLNVSQSGGRTDFDHRGGPNGGQEIVYWPGNTFPFPATYGVGVINVAGDPATVTLTAYLNGQKLDLYDFAPFTPYTPESIKSTTYTYTLAKDEIALPLVFLPLAADHPFSGIPDGNNGQPADLPITAPPPPPPTEQTALRGLTPRQAAKVTAQTRREALRAAVNPRFRDANAPVRKKK